MAFFCSCSRSDEMTEISKNDNNEVMDWKPAGRMDDLIGYIRYNKDLQAWFFVSYWPYSVDITHEYCFKALGDDFKVDGLLVKLSGEIFINEVEQRTYIEISKIEKCSSDMEIMDKDGFFTMEINDCYSGIVTNAKNDADQIRAQIESLVKGDEEWIKAIITVTPNSLNWLDPLKNEDVYFLKSDLQKQDIREGDIVEFKIVRYKLLEKKRSGSDVYCSKYFCNIKPCI